MGASVGKKTVGDYTISLDKILGQGSYGIVYKGTLTNNKKVSIAAKYSKWEKKYVTEDIDHEANIMKSIPPQKNITKIIDYIKMDIEEDKIKCVEMWIILEFCTQKDLASFARRYSLTFPQKLDIMLQCTRAMNHLHSQKPVVIHRDIKPLNILVSGSPTEPVFKLADFGISRMFERLPQFTLRSMSANMGSAPYMAPELFGKNPKYNESVDAYSAGVSFSSLLCLQEGKRMKAVTVGEKELGRYLFEVGMIEVEELKEKPGDSVDMKRLKMIISEMIDLKPRSRPPAQELLRRFASLCSSYTDVWKFLKEAEDETAQPVEEEKKALTSEVSTVKAKDVTLKAKLDTAQPVEEANEASTSAVSTVKAKDVTLKAKSAPDSASASTASVPQAADSSATPPVVGPAPPSTIIPPQPDVSKPTIRIAKVSHTILPVRSSAWLSFGRGSFIAGYNDINEYHFYKFVTDKYNRKWHKPIPRGFMFTNYIHISPSENIYIQRYTNETSHFNGELELKGKLTSPGAMIGLLADGKRAVVSDHASPGETSSIVRLSIAPVDNLHQAHHLLDVPEDRPYTRQDKLFACGLADGTVAVISLWKEFVDIYNSAGRHVARAILPSGAGIPGCSSSFIMVPLFKKPYIWICDWSGQHKQTLGPYELGLSADTGVASVSSLWGGCFSYWAYSHPDHLVNTYKVI